jgi:hypothetical protein
MTSANYVASQVVRVDKPEHWLSSSAVSQVEEHVIQLPSAAAYHQSIQPSCACDMWSQLQEQSLPGSPSGMEPEGQFCPLDVVSDHASSCPRVDVNGFLGMRDLCTFSAPASEVYPLGRQGGIVSQPCPSNHHNFPVDANSRRIEACVSFGVEPPACASHLHSPLISPNLQICRQVSNTHWRWERVCLDGVDQWIPHDQVSLAFACSFSLLGVCIRDCPILTCESGPLQESHKSISGNHVGRLQAEVEALVQKVPSSGYHLTFPELGREGEQDQWVLHKTVPPLKQCGTGRFAWSHQWTTSPITYARSTINQCTLPIRDGHRYQTIDSINRPSISPCPCTVFGVCKPLVPSTLQKSESQVDECSLMQRPPHSHSSQDSSVSSVSEIPDDWYIDLQRLAASLESRCETDHPEELLFTVYTWYIDHSLETKTCDPKLATLGGYPPDWESDLKFPWHHRIIPGERYISIWFDQPWLDCLSMNT